MAALAFKNGARDYLIKSRVSGDDLDRAIQKAIATVGPGKERHLFPESRSHTPSNGTVLVIDDDEADLKHWSDMVRKLPSNYTVMSASNRQAALALCRERTIDCVLLDLDMPESGFQALSI